MDIPYISQVEMRDNFGDPNGGWRKKSLWRLDQNKWRSDEKSLHNGKKKKMGGGLWEILRKKMIPLIEQHWKVDF